MEQFAETQEVSTGMFRIEGKFPPIQCMVPPAVFKVKFSFCLRQQIAAEHRHLLVLSPTVIVYRMAIFEKTLLGEYFKNRQPIVERISSVIIVHLEGPVQPYRKPRHPLRLITDRQLIEISPVLG